MKIAFYKNGGTLFDKLIRAVTKGKYSHCELVFDQLFPVNTLWFTSSSRDGGVRFKNIKPIENHWDIIDLKISIEKEEELFKWANYHIGIRYNWIGIARFIFPLLPAVHTRLFCSQADLLVLQQIQLLKNLNPDNTSPQNLYDAIKEIT